ncbi:MAG TPA: PilN domain-containing protein [Burkholderiales bacterium]|nr:PilN domain-containing protein [Burkholderiales bacterium]
MSQQINLYNPLLKKRKVGFSSLSLLRSMLLLAACGILVFSYLSESVARLRIQSSDASKKLVETQETLTRIGLQFPPRQKSRALEEEVKRMEGELRDHEAAIAFLRSAGVSPEEAGYSEYMRAFARQIVNGIWLTAFSIDGKKLTIDGRALSEELVPRYLNRLKQEPVMTGYSLDKLEMRLPKTTDPNKAPGYIEFSIISSKDSK